jgi:hypothetical protein
MIVDLPVVLNAISAAAVVGAVIFAALQVKAANRNRVEQAAITIVQTAQSEGWGRALHVLHTIPPGATAEEIDALGPQVVRAIEEVGIRLETIGYLVFRRIVTMDTVDELVGGVVIFWWLRLRPFVERDRLRTSNPKSYEWFQWLAERLVERRKQATALPAYTAHAHWHE